MLSRSKIEHIVCLVLNGLNILLYLAVIVAVVFKCIEGRFADIVLGIYGIMVALYLIANELQEIHFTIEYFLFLTKYRGRGLILVFFGCLVLDYGIVNIVIGTLALAAGLAYIIMSFMSSFPSPQPITINWRNWTDFSAEGLDLPHHRDINDNVVSQVHERLQTPNMHRPGPTFMDNTLKNHQLGLDEMSLRRTEIHEKQ